MSENALLSFLSSVRENALTAANPVFHVSPKAAESSVAGAVGEADRQPLTVSACRPRARLAGGPDDAALAEPRPSSREPRAAPARPPPRSARAGSGVLSRAPTGR